jgi:hypothetical protein
MIKLKISVCIEAPIEKAWAALADISNVDRWTESILSASCNSTNNSKIGTVRTCQLKGNMQITENFIEWHEADSYTYESHNILMLKYAKNKWSVAAVEGKTLLTTESIIVLKGGVFGKLVEPLMRLAFNKMGGESLSSIKYLIEQGHPYHGKYSKLPKFQMTC